MIQKIYTDAYLYDPDVLFHATCFIQRIDDLTSARTIQPDAELVLEITPDEDGEIACGYYFVHHQNRCLFWLEEFEADPLIYEIQGLSSAAHLSTEFTVCFHVVFANRFLEHEIESQYW